MWYILRCREHGYNYGSIPLRAAGRHIDTNLHNHASRDWLSAITHNGERVLDCTAEKASQSNDIYRQALERGYRPWPIHCRRKPLQFGSNLDVRGSSLASLLPANAKSANKLRKSAGDKGGGAKPFQGITDPEDGEIYQARFEGKWYLVAILPRGDWHSIGVSGHLSRSKLAAFGERKSHCIPACYEVSISSELKRQDRRAEIRGWAKGYEAGGERVRDRKFPVLFIEHGLYVPSPEQPFLLPTIPILGWMEAKHLRGRHFEHGPSEDTGEVLRGDFAALRFENRVKAARFDTVATPDSDLSDAENEAQQQEVEHRTVRCMVGSRQPPRKTALTGLLQTASLNPQSDPNVTASDQSSTEVRLDSPHRSRELADLGRELYQQQDIDRDSSESSYSPIDFKDDADLGNRIDECADNQDHHQVQDRESGAILSRTTQVDALPSPEARAPAQSPRVALDEEMKREGIEPLSVLSERPQYLPGSSDIDPFVIDDDDAEAFG